MLFTLDIEARGVCDFDNGLLAPAWAVGGQNVNIARVNVATVVVVKIHRATLTNVAFDVRPEASISNDAFLASNRTNATVWVRRSGASVCTLIYRERPCEILSLLLWSVSSICESY